MHLSILLFRIRINKYSGRFDNDKDEWLVLGEDYRILNEATAEEKVGAGLTKGSAKIRPMTADHRKHIISTANSISHILYYAGDTIRKEAFKIACIRKKSKRALQLLAGWIAFRIASRFLLTDEERDVPGKKDRIMVEDAWKFWAEFVGAEDIRSKIEFAVLNFLDEISTSRFYDGVGRNQYRSTTIALIKTGVKYSFGTASIQILARAMFLASFAYVDLEIIKLHR
jgi:hypothetical protein